MFYFQEEEENNEELNLVINFNNINMDVITKNDSFKITKCDLSCSSHTGNRWSVRKPGPASLTK